MKGALYKVISKFIYQTRSQRLGHVPSYLLFTFAWSLAVVV